MSLRLSVLIVLVLSEKICNNHAAFSDETNGLQRVNLGPTSDGRIVVPTNQVLTPDGTQLLVSNCVSAMTEAREGLMLRIAKLSTLVGGDSFDRERDLRRS